MRAVTLGMSPEQTVHGVFGAPKVGRKRRRVLCWYSGGVAPRSGRFSPAAAGGGGSQRDARSCLAPSGPRPSFSSHPGARSPPAARKVIPWARSKPAMAREREASANRRIRVEGIEGDGGGLDRVCRRIWERKFPTREGKRGGGGEAIFY